MSTPEDGITQSDIDTKARIQSEVDVKLKIESIQSEAEGKIETLIEHNNDLLKAQTDARLQ